MEIQLPDIKSIKLAGVNFYNEQGELVEKLNLEWMEKCFDKTDE